jgi:hypothetical protein
MLNKYPAQYFRCSQCDFLQTEEPHWISEAYGSAISELDLGPVNRALQGSRLAEATILLWFDSKARFIDWGGGYGIFTRLMRDKGFDFYWRDMYCDNLFAKHFVASPNERYELMTCFEVFEHLVDPIAEIEEMLKYSQSILFTTTLAPTKLQSADDWWYLAPQTGQHISIYSPKTLRVISEKRNLNLVSDGANVHLLSNKVVSPRIFKSIASDGRTARALRWWYRRRRNVKSLLESDFQNVSGLNF